MFLYFPYYNGDAFKSIEDFRKYLQKSYFRAGLMNNYAAPIGKFQSGKFQGQISAGSVGSVFPADVKIKPTRGSLTQQVTLL